VSDGTAEGTTRLLATSEDVFQHTVTAVKDKLYVMTRTELWVSDGTSEGTTRLLAPSNGALLRESAASDSQLFLIDEAGTMWRTDGTAEGTYSLPNSQDSEFVGVVGDRVFLIAGGSPVRFGTRGGHEHMNGQLWVSDGTAEGTHQLTDDYLVRYSYGCGGGPDSAIAAGDSLYFVAIDESGDAGLWTSDGTRDGTVRLEQESFMPLVAVGGMVYLAGGNETTGTELWRTDGTPEGTVQISDLNPGPASSIDWWEIEYLANNGMLYFTADDGVHGPGLWSIPLETPQRVIRPVGDSNNDGVFDSSDLVRVFQAGKYNGDVEKAVNFDEGDWNGDGLFDSSDLVAAFQAATYLSGDNQAEITTAVDSLLADVNGESVGNDGTVDG
jgi:ELWxxDGT repeat protein